MTYHSNSCAFRNVRVLDIAITVLMVLAANACSGDDETLSSAREPTQEELEAVWQEAQPIIADELAKEDAKSAVRFPCTVFDRQSAGELLGNELDAPMYAHEFKNTSNLDTGEQFSWEADACTWSNTGDGANLTIWVSRPQDFKDGRVRCHGFYDEDITEPFLGGNAKWEFLESFAWAKLLVCRDDGLFFIEIHDGPSDETDARRITNDAAARIVGALEN
ncbi:MAG TPA: hypothetical protein PKH39_14980 [Woeseiaceae bacterium]|nr:hypothetical protein [Woeseiaceae bacterium]